ncbi:hypothetical protein PV11_05908 [Exophiala sideris]|uniref:Uncharacterized protein n=1 Tax=Exophiala sideris TaxID=1016849 RepID=A0A0D1W5K4_9EURO|nr:hypothetical protein PV11_05908 [Exophiala sideris]
METPTKTKRHPNMQEFSYAFEQNSTPVTSSPSDIGSHLPTMIDPSLSDANAYKYVTDLHSSEADPPADSHPEDPISMFHDSKLVDLMRSVIGEGEEMPASTQLDPLGPPIPVDDPEEFIRNCLNTNIVIPESLAHSYPGKKSISFEELSQEHNTSNAKTKAMTPKAAITPGRASNGHRSPVKTSPQSAATRLPSTSPPTMPPPSKKRAQDDDDGLFLSSPVMPPPAKRVGPSIEQLFANRTPFDEEALLATFNTQQDRQQYQIIPIGSLSAYFRDAKAQASFKWLNRGLDDPEPPASQLYRQTGYDFPVPALSGMLTMKNKQMQPMNNPGVASFGGPGANLFQQQFGAQQAQGFPIMQDEQLGMQPPRTPVMQPPQTPIMQSVPTPATPRSGPALRFTSAQVQSRSSTPTPESRRVLSPTNTNAQAHDGGSNTTIANNTPPSPSVNAAHVEANTAATLNALGADVVDFDIDFSNVAIDFDFDFDSVAWT